MLTGSTILEMNIDADRANDAMTTTTTSNSSSSSHCLCNRHHGLRVRVSISILTARVLAEHSRLSHTTVTISDFLDSVRQIDRARSSRLVAAMARHSSFSCAGTWDPTGRSSYAKLGFSSSLMTKEPSQTIHDTNHLSTPHSQLITLNRTPNQVLTEIQNQVCDPVRA